ncbi:unnamed protein product [Calypogeia fissa]
MSLTCMPPPIAVKKGRHRIVRIPSGGGSVRNQQVGEDEFVDADGHLYRRYPIADNPSLQDPMPRPTPNTADGPTGRRGQKTKSDGPRSKVKCGKCGKEGHNRSTCGRVCPTVQTATENEPTNRENFDEVKTNPIVSQCAAEVPTLGLLSSIDASATLVDQFVLVELGGEQYSSGEEDDVGDDSLRLREIIGGKFGTT